MNKQEAISILKEHNQEHVIKRLEALEDDAAKKLISQVAMIDWKVVLMTSQTATRIRRLSH